MIKPWEIHPPKSLDSDSAHIHCQTRVIYNGEPSLRGASTPTRLIFT